jgi:serine/threonine protein kinase
MRDEKWQKINELFHNALEVEAEERLQFIQLNSDGDAEIFAEVSKLVSAHEQAKSFINTPIANDALQVISDENPLTYKTKNLMRKSVGPYILLEKLGRGAFGEVWLAEKESSLVTAKFALKFANDDDVELNSIRTEAELWQKASGHPNILPLIEANIYNNQAVIVSEYVKDGSLEIWLRNNGGKSPSQEKAVEIMNGILDGLEHLHNRRIIHRDLKPANILMQEGKPRLTDFGVSKILKDEGNTTKNISGTVAYMSPDALGGKRNFQSDLWSAAIVFYQMLSGQLPFQTPDQVSLMLAIVTKEPFPLPLDARHKWSEFFKIALNKQADLRFQTATQMKQALEYSWNNLSLEPVTRQYKSLGSPSNESLLDQTAIKQTDDFEQQTTLLDLKETKLLGKDTSKTPEAKSKKRFWKTVAIGVIALTGILFAYSWYLYSNNDYWANYYKESNPNNIRELKLYDEMSEVEKIVFVTNQASKILQEIKQGEESIISQKGAEIIKGFVDGYSKRTEAKISEICKIGDNLSKMLERGRKSSNDIGVEFAKNDLSPLIGIYLPMIESEFCPCLQSPTGPLGLFQFTNSQANEYGLRSVKGSSPNNPDGRCDPKLSAKAASVRMKKLIAEDFGDGKNRVSFAISGFNANNLNLKENIESSKKEGQNSVSFWDLLENMENLSDQFEQENSKYFPKFLAAAIIGENPMVFGVGIIALSKNSSQTKDSSRIFRHKINGNSIESKNIFEINPGETVLKIKTKAHEDIAGANIFFKDENGNEIVLPILAQANTNTGETIETVKIKSDKPMVVTMEIKELQYGSRSSYPGTLEIDFSGAFGRLKE